MADYRFKAADSLDVESREEVNYGCLHFSENTGYHVTVCNKVGALAGKVLYRKLKVSYHRMKWRREEKGTYFIILCIPVFISPIDKVLICATWVSNNSSYIPGEK